MTSASWYQHALRRYFRRSTFLLLLLFLAISYLALSDSSPQDEYDDYDPTGHSPSPTGGSLSNPPPSRPPGSYGITDLKRAMGRLGGGGGGAQGPARKQLELTPEQKFTCDSCLSEPERCSVYGSRNVDLSRAFDGSGDRIQRLLKKLKAGEPIITAGLGGSISIGQGCDCSPWHEQVHTWINKTFPHPDHFHSDGAVGARGSDYFKFCHQEHIDTKADLVLMEMSVNDFRMGDEAFENFETLLRSILSYPNKPAVIILQTFKLDGVIATGGDSQMTLAQYYDVPVISARTWLLPMLMRQPELLPKFFNYYIYEHGTNKLLDRHDLLHPNADGHKSMADTIIMYLAQQLCFLNNDRPIVAPSTLELIPQNVHNIDVLPRMRLNRQFEITGTEAELQPKCLSLDTPESPLVPIASLTHGWELWEMPGTNGRKKFWRGQKPGDHIAFEMEIVTGQVTAYFLKSAKYNLGSMDCWIDDDKSRLARLQGWWSNGQSVGEYKTIFDGGIAPGKRILHCEILEWSDNPDRSLHDFLFIGLFSV
ncbi:hypothetical protein BDY24DRAFT_401796 [Mrakia frigida]|uniref:SGNH/GDSL hydrolase family protein n=1 Tax=Mrakia frigida TaxID=29902 RepID=UPI003FCC098B